MSNFNNKELKAVNKAADEALIENNLGIFKVAINDKHKKLLSDNKAQANKHLLKIQLLLSQRPRRLQL